jgi:hypothetical protein
MHSVVLKQYPQKPTLTLRRENGSPCQHAMLVIGNVMFDIIPMIRMYLMDWGY